MELSGEKTLDSHENDHEHEGHDPEHDHVHGTRVKKIDKLTPTKIKMTVELAADAVKEHEKQTTKRYVAVAKIPGFRPGKAPLKMVQEKYGADIRKDVLSHLVQSGVHEALVEAKLTPINQPNIKLKDASFGDGKPLEFEMEFEVQPEIEIRKYKNVPLKAADLKVTDEEITKTLDNLRERMATLEPLEATKPEKGNFAVVEVAFEIEGNPPKKEPAKNYTIELGGGQVLPELETALLEINVGEEKAVTASFPADHQDKELAGKSATYQCKLLELKKKTLPELNDAFASQLRDGFTLETLKKDIRENLESSKKEEAEKTKRTEILDYLINQNPFELANTLVEAQMYRLVQWMQEDTKRRGGPPMQLNQNDLEQVRKRSENMVRGSLLLKEIAVKEKITLDEKLLESRIEEMAKQMNRDLSETRKWLSGKGMLDRLQDEVLTDQVYDFLIRSAEPETAKS